jgi:retinol dehydrogenase-12
MRFVPPKEYFPLIRLRRQAKKQLDPPTESFEGKTVLVTGANGVVCSQAAALLIDLGVDTLIFGVRSIPEGDEGISKLESLLGAERLRKTRVVVYHLDMLSLDSVKAFAARVSKLSRIDVALLGAAMVATERHVSQDGWEHSK